MIYEKKIFTRAVPNILFVFCSVLIAGRIVYSYSAKQYYKNYTEYE